MPLLVRSRDTCRDNKHTSAATLCDFFLVKPAAASVCLPEDARGGGFVGVALIRVNYLVSTLQNRGNADDYRTMLRAVFSLAASS